MNVNEAKSHYAQALLNRIKEDKDALALLGMDPNKAVEWAVPDGNTDAEKQRITADLDAAIERVKGLHRPTHGDAIAKVRGKYKKKPIGRYTPEELREPMIAFVKKNPGCKAEQIREAIGAKPTQMPTLRVLTSHAVKTKGAKRATTYWPRGGK